MPEIENLIIIGSGPAGWTAALYAARAELKPVVVAGNEPGGQLTTTTDVENYPGFPDGIQGPELVDLMKRQAVRFGTRVLDQQVTAVDFKNQPFSVTLDDGKVLPSRAVIVSTGAFARRLGLENEKKLYGKGVSACATCDGFFFKGKEVVVVGGGDAAMEESLFLTKFATKITVIVRSDVLRASKIMQERAKANQKIAFMWNTSVVDVLGTDVGHVTGVKIKNSKTNTIGDFKTDGMFTAIGHEPATKLFVGQLELDVKGYVVTKNGTSATSVPGIFVGGDVADFRYRQAVTAAGTGCMAAIDAEKWLAEHNTSR